MLDNKVENRIARTLNNISAVIPLCDHVRILDNSRNDNPFLQVMTIRNQVVVQQHELIPEWASDLLLTN